jgi:hypothetical protein
VFSLLAVAVAGTSACSSEPASIRVQPSTLALVVDSELDLHVDVLAEDGSVLKRPTPQLALDGEPVVRVEPTSMSIVGLRPGRATLVVTAGSLEQRVEVVVRPAPGDAAAPETDDAEALLDIAPTPASADAAPREPIPDYDDVPAEAPTPDDSESESESDDDGAGTAEDSE